METLMGRRRYLPAIKDTNPHAKAHVRIKFTDIQAYVCLYGYGYFILYTDVQAYVCLLGRFGRYCIYMTEKDR